MAERRKFQRYLPTGEMVMKYQIIGTGIWVFNAWRPARDNDTGSTICWEQDGSWIKKHQAGMKKVKGESGLRKWVKIGTDPDPSKYQNLPIGDARSAAVQAAYDERYAVAHKLIFQAFGDELEGARVIDLYDVQVSGGEVELHPVERSVR